jgi:hypothetical protein
MASEEEPKASEDKKEEDVGKPVEDKEEDEGKPDEDKKEDEEEVMKSVAERLKFFFSDANVRQDYFMQKFLLASENNDTDKEAKEGDESENKEEKKCAVPIDALLRFNTIKRHTMDAEVVVKAVKSLLSDKLVVTDDNKSIARVKPFTKELLSKNIPFSLYVKNLPVKDVERNGKAYVQYAVSIDVLRKLFETYGEVALIKFRFKKSESSNDDNHTDDVDHTKSPSAAKYNKGRRYPLGACVVEFESLEALEKAAADVLTIKDGEKVEPKRSLEVGDKTLDVLTLKEYIEKHAPKKDKDGSSRKRDREEEDEDNDNDEDAKDDNTFTVDWAPGCVIRLKGVSDKCDREGILEAVASGCGLSLDEVKAKRVFADFSRGQKEGAIRFREPDDQIKKLAEKLSSGELEISGAKVETVTLLEGDEEKKYWDDFISFKRKQIRHWNEEAKSRRNHHKGKRKRGRRS